MNSCDDELFEELRRLEREAGLGQGAWRHARRLKQQLRRDRVTHLRSIHLDAQNVREVHACLGQPPVLANQRCGVWYVPPDLSAGACYFKSTDGHAGHWGFSLTRINLSAALAAAEHGMVLVVDATRYGKRFPDALTKTVPIWCCVINRAVAQRRAQRQCAAGDARETQPSSGGGGGSSCWDCSLRLPPWVSPSEASQIERVLNRAVASLLCGAMASIVDRLCAALPAPLAPFWLAAGEPFAAPPRDGRTCWVVCLSASRVASAQDAREHHSWHYVQGAADDEENWTRGLSAAQWWRWAAPVLRLADFCSHAAAEAELARLQEEEAGRGVGTELRHAEGSAGAAAGGGDTSLGGAVALWDSGLLLGDAAAALAVASTPGVALLNVGSPAGARPPGANAYCHRPVHDGKSAQPQRDHLQVSVLPAAIRFARSRLERGERLLVYCERGDDRAPAVAAAILLALYTEDGRRRRPPPQARGLFGRDDARTRLALVQGAYPAARVPRAMLKEIWNFFTAQGCGWQALDFIVAGGAGAEEAPAG